MQLITFVFIVTHINTDVKLKLGWKRERMEEERGGRVEEWKGGRVEGWKGGRVEEGRVEERRVEGWKGCVKLLVCMLSEPGFTGL